MTYKPNETGNWKISKKILERINQKVVEATGHQKIQNITAELNIQDNELRDLTKELFSKQALTSKRKRKVCKVKKYL